MMKHFPLLLLILFFSPSPVSSQSSFFWEITHPETGHSSFLLGYLNNSDKRARKLPVSFPEIIKECDSIFIDKDAFLQEFANNFFLQGYLQRTYAKEISSQAGYERLGKKFQQAFGINLQYSQGNFRQLNWVARRSYPSYETLEDLPNMYLTRYGLKLGIPVRPLTRIVPSPDRQIPPEIFQEVIRLKINEDAAHLAGERFYSAYSRGDLAELTAWKATASEAEYWIRTQSLKSNEGIESSTILRSILNRTNSSASPDLYVINLGILLGEEGLLTSLESLGWQVKEVPGGRRSFPSLPAPKQSTEWKRVSGPSVPFEVALPGSLYNAGRIELTPQTLTLECRYIALYPYNGERFVSFRLPKRPGPPGTINYQEGLEEFAHSLLEVASGTGTYGSTIKSEMIPGIEGNVIFFPDADPTNHQGGNRMVGFETESEFVFLTTSRIRDRAARQIASEIWKSFMINQEGGKYVPYQNSLQGLQVSMPGSTIIGQESVPYGDSGIEVSMDVNISQSPQLDVLVSLSTGIIPAGFVLYDENEDLTGQLGEIRSNISLIGGTIYSQNIHAGDSIPYTTTETYCPTIPGVQAEGVFSIINYYLRGNRMYVLNVNAAEERKEEIDSLIASFSFLPFQAPSLETRKDLQGRYQLKLPGPLTRNPVNASMTEDELVKKVVLELDAYFSQDTISGASIHVSAERYHPLFQFDRSQEDSLVFAYLEDIWPVEGASFTLINDTSYSCHQLEWRHFVATASTSPRQLIRAQIAVTGEWLYTLYVVASDETVYAPWMDEIFSSFEVEDPQPSLQATDQSTKVIEVFQSGSQEEVEEALEILLLSTLSTESALAYATYLRETPPFLHPDQETIIPTLITLINLYLPDSTQSIAQQLAVSSIEPGMDMLILGTLLDLYFPNRGATLKAIIQQLNWDQFEGVIPPIYQLLEATMDRDAGPQIWPLVPELMQYSFWRIPACVYLSNAIDSGYVAPSELPFYQDYMEDLFVEMVGILESGAENLDPFLSNQDITSSCLIGLTSFEPSKRVKKAFKKIRKGSWPPFLQAQILQNEMLWEYKVEAEEVNEFAKELPYRKRILEAATESGLIDVVDQAHKTPRAIAETDAYLVATSGYVDYQLDTFDLFHSWKDQLGNRFVFEVEDPLSGIHYLILSDAYQPGSLTGMSAENAWSIIPYSEEIDPKTVSALFDQLQD